MTHSAISILYFSNSDTRAGAEEHILTLLRRLDRNRFRLSLMCPPACAEKLRRDVPDDVQLIPLMLENFYNVGAVIRLSRILRALDIDIVHSHLFRASLAASPIARACGVPVVLETPHVREAWRRGFVKGSYFIDRMASRFVDHYIAVSEANARYLIEEKGLPARKVHVIHNGCDLQKFSSKPNAPQELRRAMGFAETDPVLLTLGRLEPQKGHRFLLDALALVRREFPTVRLICAGEGALRRQLENQSAQLHIQENVRFVGFQPNVADWLAIANVSVLPSLFEGLPLVAIESLAAEVPMVATAVDGTSEVVVNEQTGLTVPPSDSQCLADAIIRLLREPGLASRLAMAGRKRVLTHFTQEQQIQRTEQLYVSSYENSRRRSNTKGIAHLQSERELSHASATDAVLSAGNRQ